MQTGMDLLRARLTRRLGASELQQRMTLAVLVFFQARSSGLKVCIPWDKLGMPLSFPDSCGALEAFRLGRPVQITFSKSAGPDGHHHELWAGTNRRAPASATLAQS